MHKIYRYIRYIDILIFDIYQGLLSFSALTTLVFPLCSPSPTPSPTPTTSPVRWCSGPGPGPGPRGWVSVWPSGRPRCSAAAAAAGGGGGGDRPYPSSDPCHGEIPCGSGHDDEIPSTRGQPRTTTSETMATIMTYPTTTTTTKTWLDRRWSIAMNGSFGSCPPSTRRARAIATTTHHQATTHQATTTTTTTTTSSSSARRTAGYGEWWTSPIPRPAYSWGIPALASLPHSLTHLSSPSLPHSLAFPTHSHPSETGGGNARSP